MMNYVESQLELAKNVKQESFKLSSLSNEIKNKILLSIQKSLEKNKVRILSENALDLKVISLMHCIALHF